MTALVQASVDDAELEMVFFLVVIAGNDTVRSALPGGVPVRHHP
jgi:cytochrome P450